MNLQMSKLDNSDSRFGRLDDSESYTYLLDSSNPDLRYIDRKLNRIIQPLNSFWLGEKYILQ